jgi:hypothetical protein
VRKHDVDRSCLCHTELPFSTTESTLQPTTLDYSEGQNPAAPETGIYTLPRDLEDHLSDESAWSDSIVSHMTPIEQ